MLLISPPSEGRMAEGPTTEKRTLKKEIHEPAVLEIIVHLV